MRFVDFCEATTIADDAEAEDEVAPAAAVADDELLATVPFTTLMGGADGTDG